MVIQFGFDSRGFDWILKLANGVLFRVVTVESDEMPPPPRCSINRLASIKEMGPAETRPTSQVTTSSKLCGA